jgi:hypothetical protein
MWRQFTHPPVPSYPRRVEVEFSELSTFHLIARTVTSSPLAGKNHFDQSTSEYTSTTD